MQAVALILYINLGNDKIYKDDESYFRSRDYDFSTK